MLSATPFRKSRREILRSGELVLLDMRKLERLFTYGVNYSVAPEPHVSPHRCAGKQGVIIEEVAAGE